MKLTRLIGSVPVRVTSAILVALAVVTWHGYVRADEGARFWLYAGIAITVFAFLSSIHCSHSVYSAWLSIVQRLQMMIVTMLFAMSYLVLVPPLCLIARAADSLKLGSGEDVNSYWVSRRDEERTVRFYERMG